VVVWRQSGGVPSQRDFQKSFSIRKFEARIGESVHCRGLEQMILMLNQTKQVFATTIRAKIRTPQNATRRTTAENSPRLRIICMQRISKPQN
jgi:hypothetical protein